VRARVKRMCAHGCSGRAWAGPLRVFKPAHAFLAGKRARLATHLMLPRAGSAGRAAALQPTSSNCACMADMVQGWLPCCMAAPPLISRCLMCLAEWPRSQMDPRDFVEVVSCRMNDLFDAILEDSDLLHVVVSLLTTSPNKGIQVRRCHVAIAVLCVLDCAWACREAATRRSKLAAAPPLAGGACTG